VEGQADVKPGYDNVRYYAIHITASQFSDKPHDAFTYMAVTFENTAKNAISKLHSFPVCGDFPIVIGLPHFHFGLQRRRPGMLSLVLVLDGLFGLNYSSWP